MVSHVITSRQASQVMSRRIYEEWMVEEMLMEWVLKTLSQRLDRKKRDVVRLRWKKAQLERQLEQIKQKRN